MAHILTNGDYSVTVYGAFAPQYVRTDKNGTKIYNDINCPRCAGEGESDNWWRTGGTCYACGGSGKRAKPVAVKVYTREYWERLQARRAAKAAAEAEANAPTAEELAQKEAELQRQADEARRNCWQMDGFSRDGVGYLYTGKTYKDREEIKAAGGVWHPLVYGWIAPEKVEGLKGVKVERVTAEDLCCPIGRLDPEKCEAWKK